MTVGILALQGNYNQHKRVLDSLGTNNIYVRHKKDLQLCDALIIPGGESTTISKQIDNNNLRKPIIEFSKTNNVLGTCAGMIMLSSSDESDNLTPLGLMDFSVSRNGWGRQIHSFSDDLELEFDDDNFHAVFIRAPKVSRMGKDLKVLATYNNQPVMVTDGRHYVCSFHPEIGSDFRIHEYILKQINA